MEVGMIRHFAPNPTRGFRNGANILALPEDGLDLPRWGDVEK
jgi:hypothetical protein